MALQNEYWDSVDNADKAMSYIFNGVAYLMHDAELYRGIGENALYGIWKTFQSVDTGDKDVLHTTVLKIGKNTQPEVSTFILRNVHAECKK